MEAKLNTVNMMAWVHKECDTIKLPAGASECGGHVLQAAVPSASAYVSGAQISQATPLGP